MPGSPLFRGVGVALVTFLKSDGSVDGRRTASHAVWQVEQGTRAILVNGTTGEAASLSTRERARQIRAVVDVVDSSVPVIAGCGAKSEPAVLAEVRAAVQEGASALLVPLVGEASSSEFFASVEVAAGSVPVLAYNAPNNFRPIPVADLVGLPVVGCKDSSGDANRLIEEIASGVPTYTGSSKLVRACRQAGGAGALLGVANAYPEQSAAAFDGDEEAQRFLSGISQARPQGMSLIAYAKRLLADAGLASASELTTR